MESMTPCEALSVEQKNFNEAWLDGQSPAMAVIWKVAECACWIGIAQGLIDRKILAEKALVSAHNHPRRRELPGDPTDQFLTAHKAGLEAVQHVLAKLEGLA